ncbi:MAG TPA: hypothetical protein VJU14_08670 [Solirubrobacterales bacterium]|nr:hypothetical protein [Solirubrobacterales bacterium]
MSPLTVDAGDVVTVKSANANFDGEYCLRWRTASGATFGGHRRWSSPRMAGRCRWW